MRTNLFLGIFVVFIMGLSIGYQISTFREPNIHMNYIQIVETENKSTMNKKVDVLTEEELCMAKNIYFEAGNQSREGKVAVGLVVFNRVRSTLYPNTICGVIQQRKQFSWFWDGVSDKPVLSDPQWKVSVEIAKELMLSYTKKELSSTMLPFKATHYHADYVKPRWARQRDRIAKIGNHIFYR